MDFNQTWKLFTYKNGKLITQAKTEEKDPDMTNDFIDYDDFYVNGNQLILSENVHSLADAEFDITSVFNLSKGKAQLVSKEHQIYSFGVNSLEEKRLVLKTARTIIPYRTNKCKEAGHVIPAGAKVTVKSLQVMDHSNVYKITYQGQSGYIKSGPVIHHKYFSHLEYYD